MSRDRRLARVVGTNQEGAGGGVVADASYDSPSSGCIHRKGLDQVGESAGETLGAVGSFRACVLKLAGCGDADSVSGVKCDTGIDPSICGMEVQLACRRGPEIRWMRESGSTAVGPNCE